METILVILVMVFAIIGASLVVTVLGYGLYFAFCWLIYKIGWAK